MNAAMACTSSGCRRNCGILVVGRKSCVFASQYGIHSLWIFIRTSFRSGPTFLISCSRLWERWSSCSTLRVHIADGDGQVGGLLVEAVGRVVVGGRVAQFVQARNFQLVGRLGRCRAAGSAGARRPAVRPDCRSPGTCGSRCSPSRGRAAWPSLSTGACSVTHVGGVALLAAGVVVFRVVERPEPVLVAAVRASRRNRARGHCRRGRASSRTSRAG